MKKLFVSFSSLLREILEGNVTDADLKAGFFMFGCTRGHAYDPGGQGDTDERQWNQGRNASAYPALIAALEQAEAEGRAGWVKVEPRTRRDHFEVLNEMLVKHGLPALERIPGDGWDYNYPALRDRIVEAGLPLEVIY
jgi:hypothetical protein